jgi:hypothetical protein
MASINTKQRILANYIFLWELWRMQYSKKGLRYGSPVKFNYIESEKSQVENIELSFNKFLGLTNYDSEDIIREDSKPDRFKPSKYCKIPHVFDLSIFKEDLLHNYISDESSSGEEISIIIRRFVRSKLKGIKNTSDCLNKDFSLHSSISSSFSLSDIVNCISGEVFKNTDGDCLSNIESAIARVSYDDLGKFEDKNKMQEHLSKIKAYYHMVDTYFHHLFYSQK